MYIVVREVAYLPGKSGAAVAFAHEVAKLLSSPGPTFSTEAVLPVGGNTQRIGWSARMKDLREWESFWAKFLQEDTHPEVSLKLSELAIPGTMREVIWQEAASVF